MIEIERSPQIENPKTVPVRGLFLRRALRGVAKSSQFRGGSGGGFTRVVVFCLLSSVLDFLLCTAFLLLITAGLAGMGWLSKSQLPSVEAFSLMILAAFQTSQICLRIIFRQSLGDWVFGLQLLVLKSPWKKARILLRGLLELSTGIFLLPLLSLICNRDWAGVLSGAYQFKFTAANGK